VSLLDDLEALDFSAVVDARGAVTLAVSSDELQRFLEEGPAHSVLGELGPVLSRAREGFDDPEALVAPLLGALGSLTGELRVNDGVVAEIVAVVGEGSRIMAGVVGRLTGDPGLVEVGGERDVSTALADVAGGVGDFAMKTARNLGKRRALLDAVERGLPRDPAQLVDVGLQVVLPFPGDVLQDLRRRVDASLAGLAELEVTPTRAHGVIRVLGEVRAAADAGDGARVRAALEELERVRAGTVRSLEEELRRVGSALEGLGLDRTLRTIGDAARQLRVPGSGAIEELEAWRRRVAGARRGMAGFDAEAAKDGAREILDRFETEAEERIDALYEEQMARLEGWLRGLLREIPLRRLRDELTDQIEAVARAVAEAELDRAAREMREAIDTLTGALESFDLEAVVDGAVGELGSTLAGALDEVEGALGTITAEIEALAAEASRILADLSEGLVTFREAVDEVEALVETASLEEATRSVVETLSQLRETASKLLSAAPLPEEMRPAVEQLTAQVQAIDLDAALGEPLRSAARALQLPDEVGASVQEGLDRVAEAVANLIPGNVAEELEAELDALFRELTDLDLSSLTSGISEELDAVAGPLEEVQLTALVAPASQAFDEVIATFDRLRPHRLLRPAIDAYDALLGELPVPDPGTVAGRAGQVVSTAGEAATRAATAPFSAAAGHGAGAGTGAGAVDAAEGGGPAPPLPEGVRPGDLIRLVGFIPARLREALDGLEESGAGEVLEALQALCGGLARELRRLRAEIARLDERVEEEVDALLRPVADLQVDAQLALSARGTVLSEGGVDIEASAELVASVSGAALKAELLPGLRAFGARTEATTAALGDGIGARIDEIASALEGCSLASLGDDLDAFLEALDPEPIAEEFDALIAEAFDLAAGALPELEDLLPEFEGRVRRLVERYNPGAQAQRLLSVLDVLREELDLLNPRRLADELSEIHGAVRAALTAYDPELLARELDEAIAAAAAALRAIDPSGLEPDLTPLQDPIDRVPGLLPLEALDGVATGLDEVGAELTALDVPSMIETVNRIAPQVADAVDDTVEAVRTEVVALLESIEYASSAVSASGGASVSVSGGFDL